MPLTIRAIPMLTGNDHGVMFHFKNVLHKRGSDTVVYKNTWDSSEFTFHESDTQALMRIIIALMSDNTGVFCVGIKCYSLDVYTSMAVTYEEIIDLVVAAVELTGEEVELKSDIPAVD